MKLLDLIVKLDIKFPEYSHSVIQKETGALYFLMNSTPKVALADCGKPVTIELADDYETAEVFARDVQRYTGKVRRDEKIKSILKSEFKGSTLEDAFLQVLNSRDQLRKNAEKVEPYKTEIVKLKAQMEPTKIALDKLTSEKSRWLRKQKRLEK